MTDWRQFYIDNIQPYERESNPATSLDNAVLKQFYEAGASGEFCRSVGCKVSGLFGSAQFDLSASADYDFDMQAFWIGGLTFKELAAHPNSVAYAVAAHEFSLVEMCVYSGDCDYRFNDGVLTTDFAPYGLLLGYVREEYTARDLANYVLPEKTETSTLTGLVEELNVADATGAVLCGAGVLIAVAVLAFGAKKVMKSFR